MKLHGFAPWNLVAITSVLLALALVLACGTSALQPADSQSPDQPAAKQDAPKQDAPKQDAPKDQPAGAPTAVPKQADAPAMAMKPEGTLNVGQKELSVFMGSPRRSSPRSPCGTGPPPPA